MFPSPPEMATFGSLINSLNESPLYFSDLSILHVSPSDGRNYKQWVLKCQTLIPYLILLFPSLSIRTACLWFYPLFVFYDLASSFPRVLFASCSSEVPVRGILFLGADAAALISGRGLLHSIMSTTFILFRVSALLVWGILLLLFKCWWREGRPSSFPPSVFE